jgi:hypothetical protein
MKLKNVLLHQAIEEKSFSMKLRSGRVQREEKAENEKVS